MTRDEKLQRRLELIVKAEQSTLAWCRLSGIVPGWSWQAAGRRPPLPFYAMKTEPGRCRVCGQPIDGGKVTWHGDCLATYWLWTKASDYANVLLHRQGWRCAITGEPANGIEIDHEVPIYQVRRDMADQPWFELLRFWGLGNLRAISRAAHVAKSAAEAADRALRPLKSKLVTVDQGVFPLP